MPAYFVLNTNSSPESGLEGLCCNLGAIGSTLPPPAAGSSPGRTPILAHGMGEGLLSKFAGQASGKWSVRLSRLLIVANARGIAVMS